MSLSLPSDRDAVGYALQPFEERLAELEVAGASDAAWLAFTARVRAEPTHQFFFDRFHQLRSVATSESLVRAAAGRRDGNRAAAHNYLTHGLHSYKGKYFPQLVRALLNHAGVSSGDRVVDPFAGSGTTILEAALMGCHARGIDRNPLATFVASTKVQALRLDAEEVLSFCQRTVAAVADQEPASLSNRDYLESWFPPDTLATIARIVGAINEGRDGLRDIGRLALSGLLRKWSLQRPDQLRVYRRKTAPPARELEATFKSELVATGTTIALSIRLIDELGLRIGSATVVGDDARVRDPWGKGKFQALVTSPPYATALPYIDTDRLSIFGLGLAEVSERADLEWSMIGNREIRERQRIELEEQLLDNEAGLPEAVIADIMEIKRANEAKGVGFRRRNLPALLYRYFADMQQVLDIGKDRLDKPGVCAVVIGDSYTVAGAERHRIRTADFLCQIAVAAGMTIEERIPMGGQAAYLPHRKNRIPDEEILLFRA